jgi:hypothetical protein
MEKHSRMAIPCHTKKGAFWWKHILNLMPDFKELAVPQKEMVKALYSGKINGLTLLHK